MSIYLQAALGVALVAAGAYAGYRDYWIVGGLLLFFGMLVMDFFRERVLTITRSRAQKQEAPDSPGNQNGP